MFSFGSSKKNKANSNDNNSSNASAHEDNNNNNKSSSGSANIQSTFRKKPIPVGQKGIELQAHINSTLGNNGSLREAVKLPKGEDELEWIAVNIVDFFNALVFLYDMVNQEHCTEKTCPTM